MISIHLKPLCKQIFRSKLRINYFLQCHMVSGSCIINQQDQSTVIQDSFTAVIGTSASFVNLNLIYLVLQHILFTLGYGM